VAIADLFYEIANVLRPLGRSMGTLNLGRKQPPVKENSGVGGDVRKASC
jgi:hypothetical protein